MKIIIIGGVAGGATAAARARRLDETVEIILFERGEHISFANCGLPYFIGDVIEKRDSLFVVDPDVFSKRYNLDLRNFSEVTAIDRERKVVSVREVRTGREYEESYDKIILAPGAEPIRPPFVKDGLANVYTLRNIPDTDKIKEYVDRNKPETAVVIGGGFIGLEMAENLIHRGVKTTVVEMLDQVMAPIDYEMAALVHRHLKEKGVNLLLENGVQGLDETDGGLTVTVSGGDTLAADMVILAIGVRPENALAKDAGLKLGPKGHIDVDSAMATSDPNIYAVGDAVQVRDFVTGAPTAVPLAGPANRQARIAADNVLGRRTAYRGVQGSAIVKVFDLDVAATGANEKTLSAKNIPYRASYTISGSHAGYYPGAKDVYIKLLYSPGDGRLLGAQIVGGGGVDKRIDVLASAIRSGMDVFDLEELELAYAPPFSSAKDPVNIAGYVASNIIKGDLESVNWNELENLDLKNAVFLDLRTPIELTAMGKIEDSLHIPVNDLRDRLDELDQGKLYILYCAIGLRGYIAYRILQHHGFKSINLSGGYNIFREVEDRVKL